MTKIQKYKSNNICLYLFCFTKISAIFRYWHHIVLFALYNLQTIWKWWLTIHCRNSVVWSLCHLVFQKGIVSQPWCCSTAAYFPQFPCSFPHTKIYEEFNLFPASKCTKKGIVLLQPLVEKFVLINQLQVSSRLQATATRCNLHYYTNDNLVAVLKSSMEGVWKPQFLPLQWGKDREQWIAQGAVYSAHSSKGVNCE